MAVKYRIVFRPMDNIRWTIDIATVAYTGNFTRINGNGQAAVIAYDTESADDPFSVFIKSTATINCINEGDIDINELQNAQDKDFTVSIYRAGTSFWTGYLNPDGIQQTFLSTPYDLQLTAICGLGLLDTPYIHADLPGFTTTPSRCILNYIRQILFGNLGITIPIRWTNNLQNTANLGKDVFSTMLWSVNNEGFVAFQDGQPNKTCEYILRGFLASQQCRIYQSKGMWIIRRIPDTVSGSVIYNQIPANLNPLIIQRNTENISKLIGRSGYRMITEDAILTSVQGLKSCKVTYEAYINENIVPNGAQNAGGSGILYWGSYTAYPLISTIPSLDGRSGTAARLVNFGAPDAYYTLTKTGGTLTEDGLPIDTQTIIKRLSFGFTFEIETGFAVDGDGIITWAGDPFKIQVVFNTDTTQYFLNEFGFWVTTPTFISITVDGLKPDDVAKVDFDRFRGIIMPTPDSPPVAGSTSDIQIIFVVKNGQIYALDNIYITIDDSKEIYESSVLLTKNTTKDERTVEISSAFSGYMLSNIMSIYNESDAECFYREGAVYEGCLTGLTANAIMRYRYKASRVFNGTIYTNKAIWNFDEIYNIDTLGLSKFMPLNASYDIENSKCTLVAMECRNDNVTLTEKFYSSNDNLLSN
jgi:hypothetical protein